MSINTIPTASPSTSSPLGMACAVDAKRLGHLPLVMDVFRRLGLTEIIDEACPMDPRSVVSTSSCVAVVLCGVFVGVHSLWRVAERLSAFDMATVMQDPAFDLGAFHDDRLGRALDDLFAAGLDQIMTSVALEVIGRFGVDTKVLRFDTTAFALQGDYEREDPFTDRLDMAAPPKVVRGYSKDHRPDLKQVMFGSLVSDDGGIPLLGKVLDGNTADSVAASEFFQRIRQLVRDPHEVTCVADCKAWCLPVLSCCQQEGLRLLSRLPRNHRLHQEILAKPWIKTTTLVMPAKPGQAEGDRYEYLGFDVTEAGSVRTMAADGTTVNSDVSIPARAVRIFSTALLRTKIATSKRDHEKDLKQAKRLITDWQDMAYACESDARRAADRQIGQVELTTVDIVLGKIERHDGPMAKRRGRPRKRPEPALAGKQHWRATFTIVDTDNATIETRLRESATYVLIRTQNPGWEITDEDMLRQYKRQHVIEQGFSWLKSGAEINPMFLHTPHRIASLGMLYCLGLIIWNLIQRNTRQYLNANQMALPYHRGKKSTRITTRFIFELFQSVSIVQIRHPDGTKRKQLVNFNGYARLAAQALGSDESVFNPM